MSNYFHFSEITIIIECFLYDVTVKLFQCQGSQITGYQRVCSIIQQQTQWSTYPLVTGWFPSQRAVKEVRQNIICTNQLNQCQCSKSSDVIFHPGDIRSKSSGWLSGTSSKRCINILWHWDGNKRWHQKNTTPLSVRIMATSLRIMGNINPNPHSQFES